MKQKYNISVLFFALFYFFLSMGFGLKAHYCHGNLASISYVIIPSECACGDMDKEMTCCFNEEQYFELDENRLLTKVEVDQTSPEISLILSHKETMASNDFSFNNVIEKSDSGGPPIYILFTSLILYA